MAVDIAPELISKIKSEFDYLLNTDRRTNPLARKVAEGLGDYTDANDYAILVGEKLSQAFKNNLSSDILPDGKLYYNIAERLLNETLGNNYELVADVTEKVQNSLNEQAKMGLKAIRPELNQDRINGLIDKVSDADNYDDVAWVLDEPVVNFSQSIVDDSIKANAEFQYKTGRKAVVVRQAETKCCKWCSRLEGKYEYPDVPDDVYRRHENCRCTVTYIPNNGRAQNVWTKKTVEINRNSESLSNLSVKTNQKEILANATQILGKYISNSDDIVKRAKDGERDFGTYNDAQNKTKYQLLKSIKSHTEEVVLHNKKIENPSDFVVKFNSKSTKYQQGIINKWNKDLKRNAEQATLEISVFNSRFKND